MGRTVSGALTGSHEVGGYCLPPNDKDATQAPLEVITNVPGAQSRWVGASLERLNQWRRSLSSSRGACQRFKDGADCVTG